MKDYFKRCHSRINDNRGSTLITVIVAIAFVTILTTIILGTTAVNVRMKGIDRRTKDDFYYAEKSLNDIYTGLGQALAKDAADQYEAVFKELGNDVDGFDLNMAENAEIKFRRAFMSDAHTTISGITAGDLEEYILDTSKGHVESIGAVEYQTKDGGATTADDAYRVVLKDVQVYVEDTGGFRSTITTDIVINVPTVDFLGTNADVSDYGIIANEGLYIVGGSSGCEISGNVYAGVHQTATTEDSKYKEVSDDYSKASPVYGGINIRDGKATFDGNYIISKGDINLSGTNPQIKVNSSAGDNLANLWFTSLRTITNKPGGGGAQISNDPATVPAIDINANVFALNDMALNADKSGAVIKGNYYGYNEGGLTNILQRKTGRLDGENSAIIINGTKAYLDMKDINNFVLMGKAYIDFTSDTSTDTSLTTTQVVPTAESVALKTNQQLYLVPPDFLDGANPIEVARGTSHTFNIKVEDTDLQKWFGYDFLDPSVHKDYKVSLTSLAGGTDIWYDYLVFHDSDDVSWQPTPVAAIGTEDANTKYIVKKKNDTYEVVKYSKISAVAGTGGSISSKAMFFLKIMMADNAYEYGYQHSAGYTSKTEYVEAMEGTKMQPSEYRLRERIHLSMENEEYFDLSQCVVGNNTDDAHYYAKNAVINYERVPKPGHPSEEIIQSNVLDNTVGMLRYSGYTSKLFKRYMLLCTELDAQENKLLETDPAPSKDVNDPDDWPEWKVNSPAPLNHFVIKDNIQNMNIQNAVLGSTPTDTSASSEGLKPTAFGIVVTKSGGDLDLGTIPSGALVAGNFKGVAIVDGNIVVPAGMEVDGLLLATGTITLKGNNKIRYNKGLIQSRIEKEMNIVKNKPKDTSDKYKGKDGYMNYYLISYLYSGVPAKPYLYDVAPGTKIKRERVEADYNDFVHYENWQKGEK